MEQQMSSPITEWYKGRNVLVTGATGFMGKVLLEKLLRSFPQLGNIYIVVRPKRKMTPENRLEDIIELPLFDKLRSKNVNAFEKVKVIEGNINLKDLGISKDNQQILEAEVSVVFHVAAVVRLEAKLKDSILQNLCGTKHLMTFCEKLQKLEAIIHLSTAFCHCDIDELEEKVYETRANPKYVMDLVNWMDDKTLELITPNIISPHPNTYTFTKRLSEVIANDYGKKLPVAILRPSIVIPTMKKPFPGWVDSLNGPVGVLAAASKGVLRSMLVDGANHVEVVPVDIAINFMIVSAWNRATQKFTETPVYNMTQGKVHPLTWGELLTMGRKLSAEIAFEWPLWYPGGDITKNRFEHNLKVAVYQRLPAYILDFILMLLNQKRFFIRVQDKISLGMTLLEYFTMREWKFKNEKFIGLCDSLTEADEKTFYNYKVEYDTMEYLKDCMIGTRTYCLKEDPKTMNISRHYLNFLYYLDWFCKLFFVYGLFWILYSYIF